LKVPTRDVTKLNGSARSGSTVLRAKLGNSTDVDIEPSQ
jgi:hypothetical protein